MKKIARYLIFLSLLVMSSAAFAVNGCYISNTGIIYTNSTGGSGKYNTSPSQNIGTGACLNGASGGACTVNNLPGTIGDYSVTYCPLDDYVWLLIIGSSIVGFGFLRNRIVIPVY